MIERGWTKICGVTRAEDLETVIAAGAHAVGLNFWPGSPRCISVEHARKLVAAAAGRIQTVGVVVNMAQNELSSLRGELALDWIQLHGDESSHVVESLLPGAYKALGIAHEDHVVEALEIPGELLLIDARDDVARGGTGRTAPIELARKIAARRPTVLAGGLVPENVADRIERVRPMGVDAASGVEESPGVKDAAKVHAFCEQARSAFARLGDGGSDV